jgi:hypothetical protein
MAGPNQSKKENVGIESPLPSPGKPPGPKTKPRETARIELPVREPEGKTPLPTPIPTPITAPVAHTSDSSGLREETVRVSSMPDSPEAEMRKTEPPSAMPDVTSQNPSIAPAPGKKNSMMMAWILFGVSLLILIIQIWTYLS